MSHRKIPDMSDTSNLGERKRRFPDPVSESDTEDDADFDFDIYDEIPGDRPRLVNQGREPVPKKMKAVTICHKCKIDYGKNLGRHMKTHLPNDSPEKMEWLAHKQQYQGEWSRHKYGGNEEHKLAKRAQSKNNRAIAKTKNGVEVVALQACRLDAQSQNDERVSDCMLL
jgi:hypothetical protein